MYKVLYKFNGQKGSREFADDIEAIVWAAYLEAQGAVCCILGVDTHY